MGTLDYVTGAFIRRMLVISYPYRTRVRSTGFNILHAISVFPECRTQLRLLLELNGRQTALVKVKMLCEPASLFILVQMHDHS